MPKKTKEQEHLEDLDRIKKFSLMDDDFMTACFDQNIEGIQFVLSIVLDNSDVVVKSVNTQRTMKNLLGRDIRLDIHASDIYGKEFNIEVQKADKGTSPKRARYHSSILDSHALKPNDDFDKLPETYVIFITENDIFKSGLPIYHIERQIIDTGTAFNDDEHIIYVNGSYRDVASDLGKLVHDFKCINPKDMYFEQLAGKVRYFKESEKGVIEMCKALEDMRNEVRVEERTEIIETMLKDGRTVEEIVDFCKLPEDFVRKVKEEMSVSV